MQGTHPELNKEAVYFELWKNHQDVHYNLLMQIFGLNTKKAEEELRPILNELVDEGVVSYYAEKKKYKAVAALNDLLIGEVIPNPESGNYDYLKPLDWAVGHMPEPLIRIKKGQPKLWPHLVHIKRSGPNLLAKSIAEITPQHPARIHGQVVDTEEGRKLVPLFHRYHTDFAVTGSQKAMVEDGDIVIANLNPLRGSVEIVDYDLDALPPEKYSKMVIASKGLNPHFSKNAVQEAAQICARPLTASPIHYRDLPFAAIDERIDPAMRVDYRDLPLSTVDGKYARDIDDGFAFVPNHDPDNEGGINLVVAIADVTADIGMDFMGGVSYLDGEAYDRGSSVYFPDQVVSMLPSNLSSGRFSLNPYVDTQAFVCEMKLGPHAEVLAHTFRIGLVRSHAKMTYHGLDDVIAHDLCVPGLPDDFAQNMLLADRILPDSPVFRDRLNMDLIERKIVVDHQDGVQVYERSEYSNSIIANMMVLTNAAAASHDCGIYRNLACPEDHQLVTLSDHIGDINKRRAESMQAPYPQWDRYKYNGATEWLQDLLHQSLYQDDQNQIRSLMIRSLPKARFGLSSEGHFSLGMTPGNVYENYTFFTSPIRRYADWIVHRALKEKFDIVRDKPYVLPRVDHPKEIEDHLSSQFRQAAKIQKDSENMLAMHILRHHIGQRRGGEVHEIKEDGIVIELNDPPARGFLPVESLRKDRVHNGGNCISAHFTHKRLKVGDEISVYIAKVDPVAGELQFSALPIPKDKNIHGDKPEPQNTGLELIA